MSQKLFAADALPEGGALSFDVDEKKGFAVRRDGQIYAYVNACPHLEIPLEWRENDFLDDEGELIQCSTHGALFRIATGECISGPCVGEYLRSLPVSQVGDDVFAD